MWDFLCNGICCQSCLIVREIPKGYHDHGSLLDSCTLCSLLIFKTVRVNHIQYHRFCVLALSSEDFLGDTDVSWSLELEGHAISFQGP